MTQAMKKMLNEFINRDFGADEMAEVLGDIADVNRTQRLAHKFEVLHNFSRRNQMLDYVEEYSQTARETLEKYGLEYELNELI